MPQEWEQLLGVQWPSNACDRSGECCRGAAQASPWKNLLTNAADGDLTARSFLNQFIPYATLEEAKQNAPHAVQASTEIAIARNINPQDLIFYHCRYLQGKSDCQVYEDRPALCRDFPESPFGAIPACCGYYPVAQSCLSSIETLKQELASLKDKQNALNSTDSTKF